MHKKVLNCGQCGFDHQSITSLLRSLDPTIEVLAAHSVKEALGLIQKQEFDLILVNRIFDRGGEEGLDLIESLSAGDATLKLPVLLVSNYPDAQQSAIKKGALKGFGKSQLHDQETKALLRQHLGL